MPAFVLTPKYNHISIFKRDFFVGGCSEHLLSRVPLTEAAMLKSEKKVECNLGEI